MFSTHVQDVRFGAWIWHFSLSSLQVYCSLPGELMLFLSCQTSHVALSQGFLAKGWMSLSDTLGGPHSNTHVYQEEKIIMRTRGRWMELWARFSPQLHKFLDHFLSHYVGVRSDRCFSSLLFDQGYFSCCLTIPYWRCLQSRPPTGWFCTRLPSVPRRTSLRIPADKVLNNPTPSFPVIQSLLCYKIPCPSSKLSLFR